MKTATLWAGVLFLVVTSWAFAVSFDRNITTDYVKSHPKEFTVSVTAKANGLLAFTVVFATPEPRYVVAHLVVRDAERAYAESHTPLFTRNRSNTFHFSVPRDEPQLRRFHLASPASRTLVEKLFLSRSHRAQIPIAGLCSRETATIGAEYTWPQVMPEESGFQRCWKNSWRGGSQMSLGSARRVLQPDDGDASGHS